MLEELFIERTQKTPEIDLSTVTGNLIFDGKSIPENAAKVYEPVMNWMTEYVKNPRPITNLRLNLEYYNTTSSIWLTKIIKALLLIKEPDFTLIIHLYLPVEDFDEINEFEDIKDAFLPISSIEQGSLPNIGIKIYAIGDDGEVIKESLVFIEKEEVLN
jgi:hypothetical protein